MSSHAQRMRALRAALSNRNYLTAYLDVKRVRRLTVRAIDDTRIALHAALVACDAAVSCCNLIDDPDELVTLSSLVDNITAAPCTESITVAAERVMRLAESIQQRAVAEGKIHVIAKSNKK